MVWESWRTCIHLQASTSWMMQKLKKQIQLHIHQEKERDIDLPSQHQAVEDQAVAIAVVNQSHWRRGHCSLVTESLLTSDNICSSSWRTSLFTFHRPINVSALCLPALLVLEIRNTGKLSDISDFNIPDFISNSRKSLVFMWSFIRICF